MLLNNIPIQLQHILIKITLVLILQKNSNYYNMYFYIIYRYLSSIIINFYFALSSIAIVDYGSLVYAIALGADAIYS